jgi:serine/threonine protein phosphatase PrpC
MAGLGFEILEHACLTDVGVRRSHNQDSYAIRLVIDEQLWNERGHLLLVADGMGAHAVGELASKLATDLIPLNYSKFASLGAPAALRRAFLEANSTIYQKGTHNPDFEGMGTTSSALLIRPEGAWVAHVGDSRIYRIRRGHIEQLSYDHSLQWELARRQGMDPDEIEGVPSNVIVRSLGPEPTLQVDIEGPHPLLPGDTFLLCSDGLSGLVSDAEMGAIVSSLPLREACQLLVDLANLRGGPDNITVVLVRLPGESPPSHNEIPAGVKNARRRRSIWYAKVPWPGVALGMGIALALSALLLILVKPLALAIFTFVMAALSLILGLIGLHQGQRQQQTPPPEPEHGPPRVYRRSPCRIDQALLRKLIEAEAVVQEYARENQWQVDWDAHRKHLQAAGDAVRKGDLSTAFRERCRTLAQLTDAFRAYRNKEERFNPIW